MTRQLELEVPASLAGVRLDRAVSLLTDRSRAWATDLVARGGVQVDGCVARRGSRALRPGQRLVIADHGGDAGRSGGAGRLVADETVPFEVVYADAAVIVVDKPAGVVVHPGAGDRTGTLAAGLLARFPELGALSADPASDPDRPGIVHRLDRGTSGLMVVARTPGARDSLVEQLAARRVHRVYRALAHGGMASDRGIVDAPVGRSTRAPTRMAVTGHGRPARTRYEVEQRFRSPAAATLLRCSLETGRTHQIRVHLAAIGHPVVGDDVYGRGRHWPGGRVGRPFLHATELGFEHPVTGEVRTFTSPLPPDLDAELERLS